MAKKQSTLTKVLIAAAALYLIVIAVPERYKLTLPSWLSPGFHLGLDLAGGTQLDFRISEEEIRNQLVAINAKIDSSSLSPEEISSLQVEQQVLEEQQANIVEAIRTVLERRINALGVSEAVITPSYVGDEKHLLVECPGVVDVQQCIDTVGKTIQLEFKEQLTEEDEDFENSVRVKAEATLNRMTGSGLALSTIGQDMGDDLGLAYEDSRWLFRSTAPAGLAPIFDKTPENGPALYEATITVPSQNEQGQTVERDVPGIYLSEILTPLTQSGRIVTEAEEAFALLGQTEDRLTHASRDDVALDENLSTRIIGTLRSMSPGGLQATELEDGSAAVLFLRQLIKGREEVSVSHILLSYSGANLGGEQVSRSKEEALAQITALKADLANGASFEDIARTQSDGPSAENAGSLGTIGRGELVPAFEEVAFSAEPGAISDPLETPFGYHLIRVDSPVTQTPDKATYEELLVNGDDALSYGESIITRLQNGEVRKVEDAVRVRSLFFSLLPTGWKDTALDGKHFRSASVQVDPTTNIPVVQILFDDEGGKLFQELTKNNIGKQLAIFVGGELVSAPTVQGEITGGSAVITGVGSFDQARLLAQDLNTGAIPAPIYLSGQRTVEATLGAEALQTSIYAGVVGLIIVMLYMLVFYRFLGLIADLALLVYMVIFLAILKLPLFLFSDSYIVLTLAGIAGMILSVGMAVDTNVLVFERVKEELKKGKMFKTAIEIGFNKAWPSIRDSNVSTLITCALLFIVGTSIVRGFAVTLGMGVIISMFTGIVVSRWIARGVAKTSMSENLLLFPGSK